MESAAHAAIGMALPLTPRHVLNHATSHQATQVTARRHRAPRTDDNHDERHGNVRPVNPRRTGTDAAAAFTAVLAARPHRDGEADDASPWPPHVHRLDGFHRAVCRAVETHGNGPSNTARSDAATDGVGMGTGTKATTADSVAGATALADATITSAGATPTAIVSAADAPTACATTAIATAIVTVSAVAAAAIAAGTTAAVTVDTAVAIASAIRVAVVRITAV